MSTGLTTTETKGLALQTMDDALKFGRILANSQFAPKDFQGKPESCVLAIQHGAEIGLGPMQAIQSVAVINGRPAIWGDAALALVMASPVCEYVRERIDGDGEQAIAICEAKRRGYPTTTTVQFSVADAKRAGLWGKSGPWTQYPRRMLQLRARGFALRDAFPDVLKGLVTAEEAQDYGVSDAVDTAPSVPPRQADVPRLEVQSDHMAKARAAISAARTVSQLDQIAKRINERHADGVFSARDVDELLATCNERCELIRGDAHEEVAHG